MAEYNKLLVFTVQDLECNLGSRKLPKFVTKCETDFATQVETIVARVLSDPNLRFVFISGPTSSGKTTFAQQFSQKLSEAGRQAHHIGMDDYYKPGELVYDELGRPDFESISTIDLDELWSDVKRLSQGEEINLPRFEFTTRTRHYDEGNTLRLCGNDMLVIEGLHGLNQAVFGRIEKSQALGMFIMPHMRLLSDQRMLDDNDLRLLRRISRDVNHRGTAALATIDYWPVVQKSEREFVPLYLAAADYYVNSALPYGLMVIAPPAHRELMHSINQFLADELPSSTNIKDGYSYANLKEAITTAARLAEACSQIPMVSRGIVPAKSILQEFI